ncbi:VOC family protein [Neobacillus sp. D3-1R]|uniref:VOC family protein n=1 Tax=Neobacillus sp. D3-1R TaxID=3445778 RepID=UPI003F9F00C5
MEPTLINEMHYFRLPVIDLSESIQWYTNILGFKLRHQNDSLAVLELTSGPLLVLVKADQESRGHFTINHQPEFSIGFTTSDINQLHENLTNQDVVVDEIQEDNGHLFFHFFDPTGNKLQVHN